MDGTMRTVEKHLDQDAAILDTAKGNRLRILVVDDEPGICDVFQDGLGRSQYHVTTCTTGQRAVEEAARQMFDVVFIDIMMSGMNGRQVLHVLRDKLPKALFIMITGFPDSKPVEACLEEGAFLCLSKPISLYEILDLIKGGS